MAQILFAQCAYRGAAAEARTAASMGPLIDWTTLYGYYDYRMPQYRTQFQALEDYVRKNPSSPDGRFLLGYEHLIVGQTELAHAQLAIAAVLEPLDVVAKSMLARDGVEIVEGTAAHQERAGRGSVAVSEGIGATDASTRFRSVAEQRNGRCDDESPQDDCLCNGRRTGRHRVAAGSPASPEWALLRAGPGGLSAADGAMHGLAPQVVTEHCLRTITHYRRETRQRMVTVYRDVPTTKTVKEEYTVMVPETRTRTVTETVNRPVSRQIELRKTAMTPQIESRQSTRTVCRMAPFRRRERFVKSRIRCQPGAGGDPYNGLFGRNANQDRRATRMVADEPAVDRPDPNAAATAPGCDTSGRPFAPRHGRFVLSTGTWQRLCAGRDPAEDLRDLYEAGLRAGDGPIPGDPLPTQCPTGDRFVLRVPAGRSNP